MPEFDQSNYTKATIFKIRAKKKKERNRLLLAKLEEAMMLLQDQDAWLLLHRNRLAFGEDVSPGNNPVDRMSSITFIYFPELDEDVHRVRIQSSKYMVTLSEANQKRVEGKIHEINIGLTEGYKEYLDAHGILLMKMKAVG